MLGRFARWVERHYLWAIPLVGAAWILGYVVISYLVLRQVDLILASFQILGIPTTLLMYAARKSITFGKVLYLALGGMMGLLVGSLLSLGMAIVLLPPPSIALLLAYVMVLVSIPSGAWLSYRWGRRRGFLMPGSQR